MVTEELGSIELCKKCINEHKSFVLQGGAGSGKTESLKELLLYIKHSIPEARVICITHTNVAVDEILNRVGNRYPISTIHSFLHNLIKDYKKNIKYVIPELFMLKEMIRSDKTDELSDTEYKKYEHDKYKKLYEKYASKLYSIKTETCNKAMGKKDYDNNPQKYNQLLNESIRSLNDYMLKLIQQKDYSKIYYNETSFNSIQDLSYGHDGLLAIFHLLFLRYPTLRKMIADKYDYIFIDEYQDTRLEIVEDLIDISTKSNLTIGLFGDSMQSIYSDGIGDVDNFIDNSELISIPKKDNYRCSYEVIDMINTLRLDNITQEVAFKSLNNGKFETEKDRHGLVKVLYSVCNTKPTAFSSLDEKKQYQIQVDQLISEAQKHCKDAKILILTNKTISEKNNFEKLYEVFNNRYIDVGDRIEKYLKSIQVLDVCEICNSYLKKEYNSLIKHIRRGGYVIHNIQDKITLKKVVQKLTEDQKLSLWEAVEFAQKNKLIKKTETCNNIIKNNNQFINQLESDTVYQKFKKLYVDGKNTFNKIKTDMEISTGEEFDYYLSLYKKEQFIKRLFSENMKFAEVVNYSKYLNEETKYITMHKTKGSSIPSVIVVMEEFFWNEYDFSLLYSSRNDEKEKEKEKRINSQKLIYVACSRAKNNLVCVKMLKQNEEESFLKVFPQAQKLIIM